MMLWKMIKYGALASVVALAAGTVLFGSEVWSYARGSMSSMRATVRDSVPVEFEIRRAHEMAEQIVPELRANIRRIAEEEVEVARLEQDIADSQERLARQREHLLSLRERLESGGEFVVGGRRVDREMLTQQLADQFEHYREAEDILAGKRRLLGSRQEALAAAEQALGRTRQQKQRIEQQIAALEAQHRLVEAASTGSELTVDGSQLAQTQQLVDRIRKRLDVAERVLAHEARFVERQIFDEPIDAEALLEEMSAHFDDAAASDDRSDIARVPQGSPRGEAVQ
ncbi:MAG: hypothetical protein WD009_05655 [Phycisphaeraceae bacterium]